MMEVGKHIFCHLEEAVLRHPFLAFFCRAQYLTSVNYMYVFVFSCSLNLFCHEIFVFLSLFHFQWSYFHYSQALLAFEVFDRISRQCHEEYLYRLMSQRNNRNYPKLYLYHLYLTPFHMVKFPVFYLLRRSIQFLFLG